MISKNISMPHPVLGIPDDMSGSFNVDFKIEVNREIKSYVFNNILIDISNPFIKNLYDTDILGHVIKVRCIPTYKSWIFETNRIIIPEDEIDIVIEVESFLIAKEDYNTYGNESFNDIFGDQIFNLSKGDIVGVTGSTKIPINKENERVSLGSIFKFSKIKIDEEDQELRFYLEDDEILIQYPGSSSGYDPVTLLFDRNIGLPFTAINLYIIPALTDAFSALEQDENNLYAEKRWAIMLNMLLPENERDENSFINAQKALKTGVPINLAFDEILKTKKIE